MKGDPQGRITNLDEERDYVEMGHSVCCRCGKDMPRVWDTICFKCGGTFCYDCSEIKDGHWVCKEGDKVKEKRDWRDGLIWEIGGLQILVRFYWRDFWIGAYFREPEEDDADFMELYVCILPMFPIRFLWATKRFEEGEDEG